MTTICYGYVYRYNASDRFIVVSSTYATVIYRKNLNEVLLLLLLQLLLISLVLLFINY